MQWVQGFAREIIPRSMKRCMMARCRDGWHRSIKKQLLGVRRFQRMMGRQGAPNRRNFAGGDKKLKKERLNPKVTPSFFLF
jgi:hypothetical protein